jgi:hypothetical protein
MLAASIMEVSAASHATAGCAHHLVVFMVGCDMHLALL